MLGKYNVFLKLTDTNKFTIYPFKLEVTNSSPYFKRKPLNQRVHLNNIFEFPIADFKDDENNPVDVI